MSTSESRLATAKTILSTVGSVAAAAMVVRSVSRDYIPPELQDYFYLGLSSLFKRFSTQLTLVVDEFDGLVSNEIYEAAEVYLGPKVSPNTRRLRISRPEKEKHFNIAMESNEEVIDIFQGVKFKWVWVCRHIETKDFYNPRDQNSTLRSEVRRFELTFHKKHKDFAVNSYLPYVVEEAKKKKQDKKTIKIFSAINAAMYGFSLNHMWTPLDLDHPATFETLAMDSEMKDMILRDLERFVSRREYYRKVGKAWKRGYLLYGPPGTGKSSLIAAMANYLNFDIYDLELSEVRGNSELRKYLLATSNRSILVVEDIDCSIDLQENLANRSADGELPRDPAGHRRKEERRVTLSGLLNFIDGLWSSYGDERIIIFTTNHKEKLDPALLRPGRMDVHIHMSYCTPGGFRHLAENYLGIKEHVLFEDIEGLIGTTEVTPAEVAEQLLKNEKPDAALKGLVDFLHAKRKENEVAKANNNVDAVKSLVVEEDKEGNENGIIAQQ